MSELIGSIVILGGAFFLFSAGLGLLRMPDVFTRIQAGTKASTLGNILILVGLGIYHPDWALEAGHHRLFRSDDQSAVLARALARRPRDRHTDGADDRGRCACATRTGRPTKREAA